MPRPDFSKLISRLSVGRKLMLIYLLDLTAVIFVSSILISEKFIAIDFARKEVQGNAYVTGLRDGLIDAARFGAGHGPAQASLSGASTQVAASEQALGHGMGSAELAAALQLRLLQASTARRADPAVDQVLVAGRDLLTRVANQSNLILDPDLDSYYTMSLLALRFPELLEQIHALGATEANTRTRYLILEGRLDATMQGIRADHAEAYAAGDNTLRAALEPRERALVRAMGAFRLAASLSAEDPGNEERRDLARQSQRELLGALQAHWAAAGEEMSRLLNKRIDSLYHRMWLHLGTALTLLLAILGLVTFVARHIANPLRHLAGVADTVRRTGDHRLRAQWHSSDEIGRLVIAFNDMLAQLDREREVQKELAASARAAEVEHALVEATPIPLMVTAVPGHEVLHLNTPAEAWLGDERSDPWKRGLEPQVRARFFQQLQDRGAVDEFEVRWTAGGEPAWAVLSARCLQYQGRDAVVTAFAPINHLKLMERRLQLWAKVFEASSEGIVIIDADHRTLTVNQAFSRQTGLELQDVVGERPEALHFPDVAWPTVQLRGTWQGEGAVRRRNGTDYTAWLMVSAVRQGTSAGRPGLGEVSHYIITSIDITDRKRSEARIRFLAEHDVLTELPNRSLCTERLRMAVQQAHRHSRKVAVLFLDLDGFKDINDSLGHHIGDGLLRSVAKRLLEAVRAGDTVSRLGGDEFVVILADVADTDEVMQVVHERLIPLIRAPHQVEGTELHVSCSVGVAIFPDDAFDLDELMRHADTAMYQAKASGKDNAQFFTATMTERAQARLQLMGHLRNALEHQQFQLHWQPRMDARTGQLAGVEGLLRWHHPELGMVPPNQFIPLAEDSGLIVPIGQWVVEAACAQISAWRAEGEPPMCVSINLSARQLQHDELVDEVRDSLLRHAVPAGLLELELTESMVMLDAEANLRRLHALRRLGVTLSIDDFGTGYSSLAYLNRFPIDKLKIDRSFVHDMLDDPVDSAITLAIISLGHTLGLKVVAEGVELESEARVLRDAGCDELQGFLYSPALPAPALAAWRAARDQYGSSAAVNRPEPSSAPQV
ncbi:EAL domain-containing protein [Ideonella margarita]|uniref:EAL domain-containing protein n=1 Tax=Ideonella margarita TaxID=2984191 RepID=A0ABU9C948_9BURK